MEKWEYLSFLIQGPQVQTRLNELGKDAWECVAMVAVQWSGALPGYSVNEYRVLLKRRK